MEFCRSLKPFWGWLIDSRGTGTVPPFMRAPAAFSPPSLPTRPSSRCSRCVISAFRAFDPPCLPLGLKGRFGNIHSTLDRRQAEHGLALSHLTFLCLQLVQLSCEAFDGSEGIGNGELSHEGSGRLGDMSDVDNIPRDKARKQTMG